MYKDFFPGRDAPCRFIAVITQNERLRPQAILAVCERYEAVSEQTEGKCYWVLFADEPRRPWPFTESALLASVNKQGYIQCEKYDPKYVINPDLECEVPSYMRG